MEALIDSLTGFMTALFAGMTMTGIICVWVFCALIALLLTFVLRIYIAYRMAVNRHRDPLGWVLLSFFFSPLMTWIILLIVGDERK